MTINFETMTVMDGKKYLIKNGIPKNGYIPDPRSVTFEMLETLYHTYKHSVPSCQKEQPSYFHAIPYDELSDQELILNIDRKTAREQLELAVINGIMNGSVKWPDNNMWFWQSEKDRDFVLLKKWIVHDNMNTILQDTNHPYCYEPSTDAKSKPDAISDENAQEYICHMYLWSKKIMIQTLRCLISGPGFSQKFISGTPYAYEWKTTYGFIKELCDSMSHKNEFHLFERFFNTHVVKQMAFHYEKEMERYIQKKMCGKNSMTMRIYSGKKTMEKTFSSRLDAMEYIQNCASPVINAKSYRQLLTAIKKFMLTAHMPAGLKKSQAWKNAFYGKMSYHTIDNMVKFHRCRFYNTDKSKMSLRESLTTLEQYTDDFSKNMQYYKLYAVMKKLREENHLFYDQCVIQQKEG